MEKIIYEPNLEIYFQFRIHNNTKGQKKPLNGVEK